jgi:hypothetical protein
MTTLDDLSYQLTVIDDTPPDRYDVDMLYSALCPCGLPKAAGDPVYCYLCRSRHEAMLQRVGQERSEAPEAPQVCVCGAPIARDGLCQACYDRHAPALDKDAARGLDWEATRLPNGNLHIRIGGMTAFCGGEETAAALMQALIYSLGLSPAEQSDVARLVAHMQRAA